MPNLSPGQRSLGRGFDATSAGDESATAIEELTEAVDRLTEVLTHLVEVIHQLPANASAPYSAQQSAARSAQVKEPHHG